ncbi:MAG: hypothetical protein MUO54_12645 [Anaerolineales bacterium]|nr:hypothetical protein [Anaerolineales bacterium]
MKTRLKQYYKKIDSSFPFLGSLFRRLTFRKTGRSVTRMINGRDNVINANNSIFNSLIFDIRGDDNKIEIMDNC